MKIAVNGHRYRVGQLGPDFIILNEEPLPCGPGIAEMFLSIDGQEETWAVYLPGGLSAAWKETPISAISSALVRSADTARKIHKPSLEPTL